MNRSIDFIKVCILTKLMTVFDVDARSYGVAIDLKRYNDGCRSCDIYAAFFADNSQTPYILKKSDTLTLTHFAKLGRVWQSETLMGSSHKLPEDSVEHEALEMLSSLHEGRKKSGYTNPL